MTWATRITIFRIVLIPIFVGLMVEYGDTASGGHPEDDWRYAAIAVFIVASLSDALDGYLARHWNQRSALGALLDPVADKLLLLAVLMSAKNAPSAHNRVIHTPAWNKTAAMARKTKKVLSLPLQCGLISMVCRKWRSTK